MKKRERRRFSTAIKEEWAARRYAFIVYVVLRMVVILVMISQFLHGNYENVFLCILTLALFIIPSFVESNFQIELPDMLQVSILLFIFAAEILGEVRAYYIAFPYWDTMLHTVNGFLAAAVGFSTVDILNRNKRKTIHLTPFFIAMVGFCFSMTIGVLWEFFEFFMDTVIGFDMQKDTVIHTIRTVSLDKDGKNIVHSIKNITDVMVVSDGEIISLGLGGYLDIGLIDTMKDLLVNFIGAIVFSVLGYFHIKKRDSKGFIKKLIPTAKVKEEAKETAD